MLMKLRKRMGREEGFTLIELLVVMLILGILAAIAIPTFFNQRQKAQDSSAKAAARTAQTAMETYATDNQGSYVGADVGVVQVGHGPVGVQAATRVDILGSAPESVRHRFDLQARREHGPVDRHLVGEALIAVDRLFHQRMRCWREQSFARSSVNGE